MEMPDNNGNKAAIYTLEKPNEELIVNTNIYLMPKLRVCRNMSSLSLHVFDVLKGIMLVNFVVYLCCLNNWPFV